MVNACTEVIIIHSGDAEKGEGSWKRHRLNRILKDAKDLDMRLEEKNPGKEELSVMTQLPFLTTAPNP